MSQNNRYAVIDVGTNNVLYLLASCTPHGLKILQRDSAVSRMGLYVQDGRLLPDGVKALQHILGRFVDAARRVTDQIIVVGTSASREVENIDEIANWMFHVYGLRYHVISGEEEARLNGLANAGEFSENQILLFDVGGGSTEFTYIVDGRIIQSTSLKLGIRRMQAQHSGSFTLQQKVTRRILANYTPPVMQNGAVVGIGGTATSLVAILAGMQQYDSHQVHRSILTRVQCGEVLQSLREMPHDQLVSTLAFEPERVDIIATGTMMVYEVMRHLNCKQMYVSDRGLQFGILHLPPRELAALF